MSLILLVGFFSCGSNRQAMGDVRLLVRRRRRMV